jgi:hypothetical protein
MSTIEELVEFLTRENNAARGGTAPGIVQQDLRALNRAG